MQLDSPTWTLPLGARKGECWEMVGPQAPSEDTEGESGQGTHWLASLASPKA